jgi:hypothetical protein
MAGLDKILEHIKMMPESEDKESHCRSKIERSR